MSSTPLVAWSLESPSAAAIRPSTTIGLCQCASPIGRSRRPALPVRGQVHVDRSAPLDVQQAAGEHRARAAVAVRPGLMEPAAAGGARPPCRSQVARKTQAPVPRRGLGEAGRSGPGTGTVCSSPPVVGLSPARRERLEQPQLPVLAALHEVAVLEERRRRRAEIGVADCSARPDSSASSA